MNVVDSGRFVFPFFIAKSTEFSGPLYEMIELPVNSDRDEMNERIPHVFQDQTSIIFENSAKIPTGSRGILVRANDPIGTIC